MATTIAAIRRDRTKDFMVNNLLVDSEVVFAVVTLRNIENDRWLSC